jgi:hypothetical protein
MSACGRYCCKSPKSLGDNFPGTDHQPKTAKAIDLEVPTPLARADEVIE